MPAIFLPVSVCMKCIPKIRRGGFHGFTTTDKSQTVCAFWKIGCGDGTLWNENMAKLPQNISAVLSDISEGMLRDVRRRIGSDSRFSFQAFDCHRIPFASDSFDLVIANHVLFYCDDIAKVCREVSRILVPGGRFLCSTYGASHMQEITALVQEFDSVSNYPVMPVCKVWA